MAGRHDISRRYCDEQNVITALVCARYGDPPPLLNTPERRAVAVILTRRGWSAGQIAAALGVARRTVQRYRYVNGRGESR